MLEGRKQQRQYYEGELREQCLRQFVAFCLDLATLIPLIIVIVCRLTSLIIRGQLLDFAYSFGVSVAVGCVLVYVGDSVATITTDQEHQEKGLQACGCRCQGASNQANNDMRHRLLTHPVYTELQTTEVVSYDTMPVNTTEPATVAYVCPTPLRHLVALQLISFFWRWQTRNPFFVWYCSQDHFQAFWYDYRVPKLIGRCRMT